MVEVEEARDEEEPPVGVEDVVEQPHALGALDVAPPAEELTEPSKESASRRSLSDLSPGCSVSEV